MAPQDDTTEKEAAPNRRQRSRVRAACFGAYAIVLAASCVAAFAQAQQKPAPRRPTVTLPALTAQGFDIKASVGSYLVLQKGKEVWLCYMLDTRSTCDPAE